MPIVLSLRDACLGFVVRSFVLGLCSQRGLCLVRSRGSALWWVPCALLASCVLSEAGFCLEACSRIGSEGFAAVVGGSWRVVPRSCARREGVAQVRARVSHFFGAYA